MTARHHRKVETQKKKARRAIPRDKVTRIQANRPAARKHLKKLASKARAAKAKASAYPTPHDWIRRRGRTWRPRSFLRVWIDDTAYRRNTAKASTCAE